jgi:hypothetical protein
MSVLLPFRSGTEARRNMLLNTYIQSAFHEKVPAVSGGSGAVRGESVLVGGLKGCYWSKTVWRTRELHYYIQTENIKQLRVACSECTFTVCCGCCDIMFYIESHWIHQNIWTPIVCCLFSGCGINVFSMTSSNSSLDAKSCACAYIAFLRGIFSWYADSICVFYGCCIHFT